jgi:hypothetical protein
MVCSPRPADMAMKSSSAVLVDANTAPNLADPYPSGFSTASNPVFSRY